MRLRDVLRELIARHVGHDDGDFRIVDDFLDPAGLACAKAQPQRVMPFGRVPQRRAAGPDRHPPARRAGPPGCTGSGRAARRNASGWASAAAAGRRDELRRADRAARGHGGEFGHRRMLEDEPGGELQAAFAASDTMRMLRIESPPSAKRLSWMPGDGMPSASPQMRHSSVSVGVRGGVGACAVAASRARSSGGSACGRSCRCRSAAARRAPRRCRAPCSPAASRTTRRRSRRRSATRRRGTRHTRNAARPASSR